jgi:cholesterol transport system auxiliary component
MMNGRQVRRMVIVLLVALVAGCGAILPDLGPNGEPMPRMYELTAPTEFPSDLPRVPWSLLVGRPSAVGGLNSANIAVRPTPLRMEYYADGRWTTTVPDMLQRYIITSFQNTNLIRAVGRGAAGIDARYRLETDLVRFETVYPPGADTPEILVRIHATLLSVPGGSVLASRDFEARVTPSSEAVPNVIEAFDTASAQVVQDLIRWTLTTPRRGRV